MATFQTKTTSKDSPSSTVELQILAEYYFRKGNLTNARDIFIRLVENNQDQYMFCYYLGKIYYRLGDIGQAKTFLSQARTINPLHRQTLLLLHHCHSRTKDYIKAFECILDLYILAKEVKDQHIYYYEKRIKSTSRKIGNLTTEKKSELLKERVEALQNAFLQLEKHRKLMDDPGIKSKHTDELSPDLGASASQIDEDTFPPHEPTEAKIPASIDEDDQDDPFDEDDDSMIEDIQFDVYPDDKKEDPEGSEASFEKEFNTIKENIRSIDHTAPRLSDALPSQETTIVSDKIDQNETPVLTQDESTVVDDGSEHFKGEVIASIPQEPMDEQDITEADMESTQTEPNPSDSTDPAMEDNVEGQMKDNVEDRVADTSTDTPAPAPEAPKASPVDKTNPLNLKDALLQVAFLRQLNKPKLDKIAHFTSILEFQENEPVFQENDPVFGFHILLDGEISVMKGKEVLIKQNAPKIIDEDDFFRVNYRSFSVKASSPTQVLFFNKAGYQNLYQRDAATAIQFLWHFSQSLAQKIDDTIEEILLQSPNESFMEELDQKHEVSILRKLNDKEIQVLSSLFEPMSLKNKDKVFGKDEKRKAFYVILDGRVECSHPRRNPMVIEKGEYFGEMVFCGPGYPHLFDAHVSSDHASILQISHKQLTSLTQFSEEEQKFLADMLVRILSNKSKELRELLYQTRYLSKKG